MVAFVEMSHAFDFEYTNDGALSSRVFSNKERVLQIFKFGAILRGYIVTFRPSAWPRRRPVIPHGRPPFVSIPASIGVNRPFLFQTSLFLLPTFVCVLACFCEFTRGPVFFLPWYIETRYECRIEYSDLCGSWFCFRRCEPQNK